MIYGTQESTIFDFLTAPLCYTHTFTLCDNGPPTIMSTCNNSSREVEVCRTLKLKVCKWMWGHTMYYLFSLSIQDKTMDVHPFPSSNSTQHKLLKYYLLLISWARASSLGISKIYHDDIEKKKSNRKKIYIKRIQYYCWLCHVA